MKINKIFAAFICSIILLLTWHAGSFITAIQHNRRPHYVARPIIMYYREVKPVETQIKTVVEYVPIYVPVYDEVKDVKSYKGISEGDVISANATHFDICVKCCGKIDGITASGEIILNGTHDPHVVACNWLPLGSIVEFDGQQYSVVDRGGSGLDEVGRIDIFTPQGHSYAENMGRKHGELKIIYLGD